MENPISNQPFLARNKSQVIRNLPSRKKHLSIQRYPKVSGFNCSGSGFNCSQCVSRYWKENYWFKEEQFIKFSIRWEIWRLHTIYLADCFNNYQRDSWEIRQNISSRYRQFGWLLGSSFQRTESLETDSSYAGMHIKVSIESYIS